MRPRKNTTTRNLVCLKPGVGWWHKRRHRHRRRRHHHRRRRRRHRRHHRRHRHRRHHHRRRRHHNRRRRHNHRSRRYCINKTWRINLLFKRIRIRFNRKICVMLGPHLRKFSSYKSRSLFAVKNCTLNLYE